MSSMQQASTAALHKGQLVQQLQAELEQEKGSLLAMRTASLPWRTRRQRWSPACQCPRTGAEDAGEGNLGTFADQPSIPAK